jgi:catechol 2,3-dioxygenase
MGHVHLQVADVDSTVAFYRDLLGFGLMAQLGDSAAFLAAGGYHHHLGANTWESRGASPPPAGTAALRHATIVLPDEAARDRVLDRLERAGHTAENGEHGTAVSDPSGNRLVLSTE